MEAGLMKSIFLTVVLALPVGGYAQTAAPRPQANPPVVEGKGLYWSGEEVKKALVAGAAIPLPRTPSYFIAAQNRTGKPQPAEAHANRAQFYVVLDGSGTIVVGGEVPNSAQTSPIERRGQPGQSIVGGTPYRVKTGDMLLIPKNTWHSAEPDPGGLRYVLVNLIEP
jgi:mannose-6-phosphate isomerase-like protein (cupin superfamily)